MSSSVNIAEDLAPSLYGGVTLVGTSEVQAVSGKPIVLKGVQLKALGTNTGVIYIGMENKVTTGNGFPLEAGEGLFVPVRDVSKISAIASDASQSLRWFAV